MYKGREREKKKLKQPLLFLTGSPPADRSGRKWSSPSALVVFSQFPRQLAEKKLRLGVCVYSSNSWVFHRQKYNR